MFKSFFSVSLLGSHSQSCFPLFSGQCWKPNLFGFHLSTYMYKKCCHCFLKYVKLVSSVSVSSIGNNNTQACGISERWEKQLNGKTKLLFRTLTTAHDSHVQLCKDTYDSQASEMKYTCEKANRVLIDPTLSDQQVRKFLQGNGMSKPVRTGTMKPLYPACGKSVVVVESVAKAATIQGYLGGMYEVLASHGHMRDLASRPGSVRPDDDFSMVWEVPSSAWTYLTRIAAALDGAENLILASDPDREGEAIAWHVFEMLEKKNALRAGITVARVVFHEITEASIINAMQAPRDIDVNLVHSYLARRALDYLIGFNISPLLWKKLPGCSSAGRVQSAALSLICGREMEIDNFKQQKYWTVEAYFGKKENSALVTAHLTHLNSKRINQFSTIFDTEEKTLEQKIRSSLFSVVGCKKSKVRKSSPSPYRTSTLQQDASNILHFSTTQTMKVAQKLYEGVSLLDGKTSGLITYLRTDSLHVSDAAARDLRGLIIERYGPEFALQHRPKYLKKMKKTMEAHEAIRPIDIKMLPSMLVPYLNEDSLKLYTLIWAQTMASQMKPMVLEQIQVHIGRAGKSILFRSGCSRIEFRGYNAVFEDVEACTIRNEEIEAFDSQSFQFLDSLKLGDPLYLDDVKFRQHFTQHPPRYSEGSLVEKLDEVGIGRPSTYAIILKVLADRRYVSIKNQVVIPEFLGRMVSAFLSHYFAEITDCSFTADMECKLDNVSVGLINWKDVLRNYWSHFSVLCTHVTRVDIHEVEKMLEKNLSNFLFDSVPNNRICPSCMQGTLIFKVNKLVSSYCISCDKYPKCRYIFRMIHGLVAGEEEEKEEEIKSQQNNIFKVEQKLLGLKPISNEKVFLKMGPYGSYLQLGEGSKGFIPRRVSMSHVKDVDSITLEDALDLFRYPVSLGNHPNDGHSVILKLSKAGFSVNYRNLSARVPKKMRPEEMTLDKALELLSGTSVSIAGRPMNKGKA